MSSEINGFYLDYSSLFNYGVNSSGSSNYSNGASGSQSTSASSYNYGVNNSKLTDEQIKSIMDFKGAAETLQQTLGTLLNKKNDGSSIFGAYKAVSGNADALSATYNNDINKYSSEALLARRDPSYKPSAPKSLAVKTLQLAQTQKNTGDALAANGMGFEKNKTYRFEINDGNKTTEISFVTESGDTNESIQKKIAQAINDKNIGVKASVTYNGENKTSTLNLESRETGLKKDAQSSFTVTDKSGYDAVAKLGIGNVTQEAQNAKYYVKGADGSIDLKESMSNDVALTDRTSVTLKKTTDDYVSIDFERNTKSGVNAVREMVNGFNALYEASANGSTVHSSRLASQLQGLAETYSKQLAEVGISRDEKGFLVIDEDKMEEAAKSGALENLFNPDDKNNSYGFAQRLNNIANTVAENPNQYALSNGKTQSSSSSNFWDELNSGPTGNYSKLYFNLLKYENMGSLFNSMF